MTAVVWTLDGHVYPFNNDVIIYNRSFNKLLTFDQVCAHGAQTIREN